jgi:hypothetical protein
MGNHRVLQNLADNDPSERSPGHGERSDEHASSNDHDNARAWIFCRRTRNGDRCEDKQPCRLPESAKDQGNTATDSFDQVQAWERSDDIYCAED